MYIAILSASDSCHEQVAIKNRRDWMKTVEPVVKNEVEDFGRSDQVQVRLVRFAAHCCVAIEMSTQDLNITILGAPLLSRSLACAVDVEL